jgi:hypothetical protein
VAIWLFMSVIGEPMDINQARKESAYNTASLHSPWTSGHVRRVAANTLAK